MLMTKGAREERAMVAGRPAIGPVNFRSGGNEPETAAWCQDQVDAKALTGRGNHLALRQAEAEVDRAEARLRELSEASKQVAGAQIYLMLHRRARTGYEFLRWREYGARKRHLSWEHGAEIYGGYPEPLRAWYAELAAEAQQANEQHVLLRQRARSIRVAIQGRRQPVFARPIPEN